MGEFIKRVIWYFTPAKTVVVEPVTPDFSVTQEVPSLYISKIGHVVLGIIYSTILFGYCGLLLLNWFMRDPMTEYRQVDSRDYAPATVQIHAWCSNHPRCGNIVIRANYSELEGYGCDISQFPSVEAVRTLAFDADTTSINLWKNTGFNYPLCFNNDPIFTTRAPPLQIPGITVEFSEIDPGRDGYGVVNMNHLAQGVIKVVDTTGATSAPLDAATQGRPVRIVNVDTHQIKSLVLKEDIVSDHGTITNRSLASRGIQYDGKYPTSWAGTTLITLQEKADMIYTYKTHWLTILGTLGSMAMSAWVVFVMMLFIIPIWPLCFPGPAQELINSNRQQSKMTQMLGGK